MKKEIVKKLIEAGHINFDEALILMETEKEYIYKYIDYYPWNQPYGPIYPQVTFGNPTTGTFTTGNSIS